MLPPSPSLVAATLYAGAAFTLIARARRGPLVSFGLVADVQGGDKPDTGSEGRVQRFRAAQAKLGAAVDHWRGVGLQCVVSLGDIVDGGDDIDSTRRARDGMLSEFNRLECASHHVIGNHCLKYAPRAELLEALGLERAYYTVDLAPGWRLIVLDTTDLSVPSNPAYCGWAEGTEELAAARAFLAEYEGEARMRTWNGGVGAAQLTWLRDQLERAEAESTRLIVASHHALAPGSCRETHRAWNGDEVAELLCSYRAFALALAGHDHVRAYLCAARAPSVLRELPAVAGGRARRLAREAVRDC